MPDQSSYPACFYRRLGALAGWMATLAIAGCSSPVEPVATSKAAVVSGPVTFGNLVLWLDARAGVTQASGLVSTWADQSGNGNDVSQDAGALQPTFNATGAGASGDNPSLTFGLDPDSDASTTYDSTNYLLNSATNLTSDSSDTTVLVASHPYVSPDSTYGTFFGGNFLTLRQTNYQALFDFVWGANTMVVFQGPNEFEVSLGLFWETPALMAPMVLDWRYHLDTETAVDLNGSPLTIAGPPSGQYNGQAGFSVGSSTGAYYTAYPNHFWGDIYEVLLYRGVLTASNLATVRQYLGDKWGIPITPLDPSAPQCPDGAFPCGDTCLFTAPEELPDCNAEVIPASWRTPAWYIDPSNVTGTASDGNTCTNASQPCLSYARVQERWGTSSPRLRQNTTITFLSSQTDDADPVYFTPYIENAATVTLQGALGTAQQVATGALGVVSLKSPGAGTLLRVTLPAGTAPGELVVDTARSSRAWVYKSAGGGDWYISQPVAVSTATAPLPLEDNGWTSGDTVVIYRPVVVDVAQLEPLIVGPGGNMNLSVSQLAVADSAVPADAATPDGVVVNTSVLFSDSSIQKTLSVVGGAQPFTSGFVDVDFTQSIVDTVPGAASTIWAGQTRYGGGQTATLDGFVVDSDFIANGECDLHTGSVGTMFLDTNGLAYFLGSPSMAYAPSGSVAFWGPGAVDVGANARLGYPPTNTAESVFLETGGLFLDESPTLLPVGPGGETGSACAISPSGSWTCGIALSPANLDAPLSSGGFGGTALNPGGATITDHGTVQGTTN